MKIQVLINNYNYAAYISECLDSLLSQSTLPDEVVFVDDGSQDDSLEIAKKYEGKFNRLVIVSKDNKGQLSALNEAMYYIDKDALVFLMDSDDIYPPDYISELLLRIDDRVDVFFAAAKKFELNAPKTTLTGTNVSSYFYSTQSLARLYRSAWVGNVTSSIAISGAALKSILPYPHEKDWITRADDVIVFGSSLLGLSKQVDDSISIGYRQHQFNLFARKKRTRDQKRAHRRAKERLIKFYCQKAKISRYPSLRGIYLELKNMACDDMRRYRVPSLIRFPAKLFKVCRSK